MNPNTSSIRLFIHMCTTFKDCFSFIQIVRQLHAVVLENEINGARSAPCTFYFQESLHVIVVRSEQT